MANFLDNKKSALAIIVILAVGAISGVATAQFVMASQIGKLCVFFACGNANITGGTTSSSGQPTPNTATLIVTKICVVLGESCPSSDVKITVTGNSPSPSTFNGDAKGTTVTLGPGAYKVTETTLTGFAITFSGSCQQEGLNSPSATGSISAGDSQECTITNNGGP